MATQIGNVGNLCEAVNWRRELPRWLIYRCWLRRSGSGGNSDASLGATSLHHLQPRPTSPPLPGTWQLRILETERRKSRERDVCVPSPRNRSRYRSDDRRVRYM